MSACIPMTQDCFFAPFLLGLGGRASFEFRLMANKAIAWFRKAADFPWSPVAATGERGTGVRILSGLSIIGQANNSLVDYLHATYEDCPTDPAWSFPFGVGQKCVHWNIAANLPPSEFLSLTPDAPDWHGMGGWKRYPSDLGIVGNALKPPLDIYCADNLAPPPDGAPDEVHGQRVAIGAAGDAAGVP